MTEGSTPLAAVYEGWENYQQQLIKAITPLSTDQLALRAAPNLRSIGELVSHVIGARARWVYYVLEEGDEELPELARWDRPDAPARTAAELVDGLESSWRVIRDALGRWTVSSLEDVFEDTEDGEIFRYTRQWVIWHLIEHEVHHGGEASFTLGMHGIPGVDL